MRAKCYDDYLQERQALKPKDIDTLLESGRKWKLDSILSSGGAVVFPHTFLSSCGSYIAAAVHAALDSGADHVVALGVLHATTPFQKEARHLERERKNVDSLHLRALFGDDLPNSQELQYEYSLLSFQFLWDEEVKRRAIKPPKLFCRYPFLVNREPETMPGIKELSVLAKDAAIVATSDFCHHGVAYDEPDALPIGQSARSFAEANIVHHLQVLTEGSYEAFYEHCFKIKSDSYDVGSMLKYLCKPSSGTLLDMQLVDTSMLYENNPSPSWVAASLVALQSKMKIR